MAAVPADTEYSNDADAQLLSLKVRFMRCTAHVIRSGLGIQLYGSGRIGRFVRQLNKLNDLVRDLASTVTVPIDDGAHWEITDPEDVTDVWTAAQCLLMVYNGSITLDFPGVSIIEAVHNLCLSYCRHPMALRGVSIAPPLHVPILLT